jgi:hypothetical protein
VDGKSSGRAPSWKVALLFCAGFLLGIFGSSFWVVSLRNRNWARLEARVRELQSEIVQAPPLPRLPLGRPALPGNAWDDYLKAWARAQQPLVRDFLARKPGISREQVESIVSRESARIDLLRSGVRREVAKPPAARLTTNGLEPGSPNVYLWNLIEVAVAKARLLAEAGKGGEALGLLTDLCLAGRDWAGARLMGVSREGLPAMDLAFCELRDLLQSSPPLGEGLEELDRSLALLDGGFPDTTGHLRDELLNLGELLIREDRDDEVYASFSDKKRFRRSWRSGFSSRLQATSAFFAAEDLVRRELEIEKLPWSEGWRANQNLYREMERHPDPLISQRFGRLLDVHFAIETRGSLRLLRVAVHYRATGEFLELQDPWGGPIRTRPTEGTVLMWKKPVLPEDGREPATGDKVYRHWNTIEVPRR